jgi:hypothetical protein
MPFPNGCKGGRGPDARDRTIERRNYLHGLVFEQLAATRTTGRFLRFLTERSLCILGVLGGLGSRAETLEAAPRRDSSSGQNSG